ncbi:MAG: hypothetical protein QF464_23040, partial [Myxococcota bacterium]|nr:hypothetical protein [Myxococcota bacterium]
MTPNRAPRWFLLCALLGVSGAVASSARADTPPRAGVERTAPGHDLPRGLRCLWHAYPTHICQVKPNALVWCDGTEMVYDTGEVHGSHEDLLNDPDLQDMMAMRYPVGADAPSPPPRNFEPGRVRYEPFFRKMYGGSRQAVSRQTAKVRWFE